MQSIFLWICDPVCLHLSSHKLYGTIDSCDDFLFVLAELNGYIDSHTFDSLSLVGDFNVDFNCGGPNSQLLTSFIDDLQLVAADHSFRPLVI